MLNKIEALNDFLPTQQGQNLLAAYKRAHNILRGAEQHNPQVNEQDFSSKYESDLYESAQEVDNKPLRKIDIDEQLNNLSSLAVPLNNFLDNVTVMDRDPNIARKRLALLHYIKSLFHCVARFDRLL